MTFFSFNALNCVSINNQEFKTTPEMISINSNEPSFYPYSVLVNNWSDSCNNINDPYAKLCASDLIENMNSKVFNRMSRINETGHLEWHEICVCKSRLDASASNDKPRWNNGKYRCECKELIDKGRCNKGSIWNSSICEYSNCLCINKELWFKA